MPVTPTRLNRLLAICLLLLGLLTLPATAQEDGTDPPPEDVQGDELPDETPGEEDEPDEIAPVDADQGDEDAPDDADEHPTSGNARLATGEVAGRLAPAVARPGQQVVVHALIQLFDHPGQRPDHAGPPNDVDEDPSEGPGDAAGPSDAPPTGPSEDVSDEPTDTADSGDEVDDAHTLDVTFTVDYGDGSPVEDMRPTKTRGRDGSRRAIARHIYAAEGTYDVVITVTPREGEPATISLVAQVGEGEARLDGDSRIDTAVAISQDAFPDDGSADAVLLARADEFADALAASTLAFVSDAPVLLTGTGALPDVVIDEIDRVLVEGGPIFLLGGESAISADVAQVLTDLGYLVIRLSDEDRIGTALAVAQYVIDGGLIPEEVVVAAAGDFPDALAGAAYAAANGGVVLLTDTAQLDSRVAALITGLPEGTEVIVAGGESAVSAAAYAELEALGLPVSRVAGASRYDTAALLAELGYGGGDTVVLATGTNYPDALAGAVYAARLDAPVLLVDAGELPEEVAAFLTRHAATLDTVLTLGGTGAVPDSIIDAAAALIAETAIEEPADPSDGDDADPTEGSVEDGAQDQP